MRDLLLLGLFFAVFPFVFTRPYIGIYLWSLFAYLNPHRLTWGVAFGFPFSQLIAVGTLAAILFSRDRSPLPRSPMVLTWLAFAAWMCITTPFALEPDQAIIEWDRSMKIQLFSFLTIILINSRQKLRTFVWILALSLAFYGIKGGIFSIATGGSYRVFGPESSFIEDNNALGLAFVMTIPLQWYLWRTVTNRNLKYAVAASLILTAVATLTTHSRGALLGLITIVVLWLVNERKKGLAVVMLATAAPTGLVLMPDSWFERMESIGTYEQDASAMGRILAWRFAIDLSGQRLVGGGFGAFTEENYRTYAPDVAAEIDEKSTRFQNAHSAYFGVLGEHGVPGLALFLLLGFMTLRKSHKVQKAALEAGDQDLALLAATTRIGLIGYAVSGAFLNLAYFDLYYHLVAIIVILDRQLIREPARQTSAAVRSGPASSDHTKVGSEPAAAAKASPESDRTLARLRK
jgi:probable O-glycosylation ligase (exosortase A-associated)